MKRSVVQKLAAAISPEACERLEVILERFEDAWRRGERPALEDYLGMVNPAERAGSIAP
jgi:hypothetical protein